MFMIVKIVVLMFGRCEGKMGVVGIFEGVFIDMVEIGWGCVC